MAARPYRTGYPVRDTNAPWVPQGVLVTLFINPPPTGGHKLEENMWITNAFSLNMLAAPAATIKVAEIGVEEAKRIAKSGLESAVGHADTAGLFSTMLGVPVPFNRVTVKLARGDSILVGQYSGPRLPEGATTLPEGATVRWMLVAVE